MKTRRITITVQEDISDLDAIMEVAAVIQGGKISKDSKGKPHYCWLSVWDNEGFSTAVATRPKYRTDSDRFIVSKRKIN